jgi:drug/metabolite transporter (DMT)-like permease
MSTPDPTTPPAPQPSQTPPPDNGSMVVGFVLGWVAMIVGVVCNALFWALQSSLGLPGQDFVFLGVGTLPLLAMVALAIWFSNQHKSRSVRGVLLAFGSMIALVLLLVAACFGILLSGGFGNMH